MAKVTIEIDDDLDERLGNIKSEAKDYFLESVLPEYVDADTEIDDLDTIEIIDKANYSGDLDSIVDNAVPVYTRHIDELWVLHKNEFEDAFEGVFGSDENPLTNYGMTAIYCYLEQEFRAELEDLVLEWAEEYQNSLTGTEV